jgi:hypothetical protein
MSSHELIDELTVLYVRAHHIRNKVISNGITEVNVDVRSAMDDVIARVDLLSKVLAVDILHTKTREGELV